MGKSSSSRRKKRSKISSKKSRKTSKSRKLKSKKLQTRDDSLSFSDGGSSTFSSSDSEDDNRRRKRRSSTRKNVKKRAKRQSSSSEDYSRPRRKSSKKTTYDEVKKKTNSKKKRKRDLSISSYSSESRSCSTCHSESSRTTENEFDSDRGRSAKRHNKKRDLENSKSVNKYRGCRSRSGSPYSSCGQRSDCDCSADEEKIVKYNYNSKRLKSVIVIQGNENREHNNGERVEEITFGDSAFEEEPMQYNGRKVEVKFDSRNLKMGDTKKDSKLKSEGIEGPVDERKTNFSGDTVSENDVDMELILRQKALENLKRFRGGIEKSTKTDANQKVEGERDANNSSCGKVESCNIKFPENGHKVIDQESLKVDNGNKVCSKPCKEEDFKTIVATEAVKGLNLRRGQCDSAHSSQNISDGNDGGSRLKQGSSYSAVEESMDQVVNKSEEKSSDQKSNEHYTPPMDPRSSLSIMSGENTSSTKPLNDSKEGSQFEQKTMSVMRGGEMVEVSYKVYIPKKAPALSRRQLKR